MVGLIALLAALAGPPVGPVAVFWGGGQTWAVDAGRERLLVAPGWLVPGPDGPTRYRLRRVAERAPRGDDGLPRHAHRWTVFERLGPSERRWTALTEAPTPPAEGQLFDEHHPVQFAGDRIAFVRARRVRTGVATDDALSAFTLALPAGDRRPTPPDAAAAVAWMGKTLPGIIEPCVDRPAGLLALDTPGGIAGRWLVVTGVEHCADRAHGLALDRPTAARSELAGARWVGERFEPDVGAVMQGVVDVRPDAEGRLALLLSGPALPAGRRIHRDLARFDDPCTARDLTLWRAGRTAPLGRVPALNGARWMALDEALTATLDGWFVPADGGPCHRPLSFERTPPVGRACQITEDERPWAGPADLSTSAYAEPAGSRLAIVVEVRDPERTAEDGVELYLGPGRRAQRVHLGPEGLEVRGGRKTQRRIARQLDARWTDDAEGYTARFEIDRALLGRPPALTVRVDDADADGTIRAWPVGGPIDSRNPRAMPLEAP